MSVHTGPMRLMSFLSFSRRFRPRSTASATAIAWGRVKLTVALMLIPRAVASSTASIPACVAGIFTIMFGASSLKRTACSTIASALRYNFGSVWMERRPFRPFSRSNTGARSAAAFADISSTRRHAMSASGRGGHLADELGDPVLPEAPLLLQNGKHDDGIACRPHGPVSLDRRPPAPRGSRNRSTARWAWCGS